MSKLAILFLIFFSSTGLAQNAGNIWYFGQNAGLDFNTSPPTALSNGALNTTEGCASIADPITGQLLFYTDGIRVWDKTHTAMPASITTPLNGNPSSTQSGVIVPKPGSPTIFYIFTTPAQVNLLSSNDALCYSIVDMSLNGGNGNLTSINNPIMSLSTEKIAVVGNCNNSAFWIVGHKWNCDSFYAFRLTATGLSAPVKSNTGIVHQDIGSGVNAESIGYMKFSSDAKKLGVVIDQNLNTVQIFDFNDVTGIVSNPITDVFTQAEIPYGCSFSPDNSKFYVGNFSNTNSLLQYDMNAGNGAAILASRYTVASSPYFVGGLQNGPDGKMYVSLYQQSFLDVVNNPNALGAACMYQAAAINLAPGTISLIGLPGIVESFLSPGPPSTIDFPAITDFCIGDTVYAPQVSSVHFTITPSNLYSVNADSSMILFFPMTTTTYTIVSSGVCGSNDTSFLTIHITPNPHADFSFVPTSPSLNDATITLQNTSQNAVTYAWYTNNILQSTNTYYTFPNPGLGSFCYNLIAYNALQCSDNITKCITIEDTLVSTIFIPNAFSPNGDGLNDVFRIQGTNISLTELNIYNRYGELIFTSSDILAGWNGKQKGKLCDGGVYFYSLIYYDSKYKQHVVKGDITLML